MAELCLDTLVPMMEDPTALTYLAEAQGIEAVIDILNMHSDDTNVNLLCIQ